MCSKVKLLIAIQIYQPPPPTFPLFRVLSWSDSSAMGQGQVQTTRVQRVFRERHFQMSGNKRKLRYRQSEDNIHSSLFSHENRMYTEMLKPTLVYLVYHRLTFSPEHIWIPFSVTATILGCFTDVYTRVSNSFVQTLFQDVKVQLLTSSTCSWTMAEWTHYTLLTTWRRLLQQVDVDSLRNEGVHGVCGDERRAERVLAKYTIDHGARGEGRRRRERLRRGEREWGSRGGRWVGADKAELWRINLSWVCFRADVVEGQALCSGALEVLSGVQTPCLRSPAHTQQKHTLTHTHKQASSIHNTTKP